MDHLLDQHARRLRAALTDPDRLCEIHKLAVSGCSLAEAWAHPALASVRQDCQGCASCDNKVSRHLQHVRDRHPEHMEQRELVLVEANHG